MNISRHLRFGPLLAGLLWSALTLAAVPQADKAKVDGAAPTSNTGANALAEVVVTAQRRAQNLQAVPIAVTSIRASELAAKGIQNTMDLAEVVPGLTFTAEAGSTQVRIRGVGTNGFGPGIANTVATYVDGVYIGSMAGDFFDLADVERVEVDKGPQGTLFGRNATGGAIQIITPDPSHQFKGMVSAGYGNYGTSTGDLYVTGGLSETVAADLAVHYSAQSEGWGRNLNTGNYVNRQNDDLMARSKLLFAPTEDAKFVLEADYDSSLGSLPVTLQERAGNVGFYELYVTNRLQPNPSLYLPLVNHGGFYDNNATIDPRALIRNYGTSLTGTFKLDGAELKSITAYRGTRFDDSFDITRIPQPVLNFNGVAEWSQFSQEFRLSGNTRLLNYTTGIYYFSGRDAWDPFALNFGNAMAAVFVAPGVSTAELTYNNKITTDSSAAYGQVTFHLPSRIHLTLGGRFTHERKSIVGTQNFIADFGSVPVPLVPPGTPYLAPGIPNSLSYNNFSYRIALDRKFTDDVMGYVSYSTGFNAGGFNSSVPTNPPFKPEELRALEAGVKSEFFNHRVRLNASVFTYDFTNIQVNDFVQTSQYITNGPKARMDGLEIDADTRATDALTLSATFAYTDDRFTEYPLADYYYLVPGCDTSYANVNIACKGSANGNRLPGTPTATASIGYDYETAVGNGVIGSSGNVFFSSGFYGTTDNDPQMRQASYDVLNDSVYFERGSGGLRFTLWGRNLLNKQYVTNYYSSGGQTTYQAAAPRTFGISVEKKF